MKKTLIVSLLVGLCSVVVGAEKKEKNFLDGLSLTTEGFYRADISNGGGEWGAGSTLSLQLQKNVNLNIRNLAYEHDNWGGSTIDESQAGVSAKLFSAAKGKLTINGEADYCRNWESKDNGIGVGGNANYAFTKNISVFGGVQYRVWNKGANDMMYPFGVKFSF